MATIRFPEVAQFEDSNEGQNNSFYNHLIAIEKEKGSNQANSCSGKGVVFDYSTNVIFTVESGLHRSQISIFSQNGELLGTFVEEKMKSPCGIAVHKYDIYVTDMREHCIFHFTTVPIFHLISIVGGKGTGLEEFHYPNQLTVSMHGDVFVSDCMNDRLKVLNSATTLNRLSYQKHFSHYTMTKPCDVKLTPDESIYALSYIDSFCVHVFSRTGEKISSLITSGDIGMQVMSPHFFCLDNEENLFISDSGVHQVKVFSKEGTLLHKIGERGEGVGELIYPQGIALISNLKIAVASQNNNYRLQIFCP